MPATCQYLLRSIILKCPATSRGRTSGKQYFLQRRGSLSRLVVIKATILCSIPRSSLRPSSKPRITGGQDAHRELSSRTYSTLSHEELHASLAIYFTLFLVDIHVHTFVWPVLQMSKFAHMMLYNNHICCLDATCLCIAPWEYGRASLGSLSSFLLAYPTQQCTVTVMLVL